MQDVSDSSIIFSVSFIEPQAHYVEISVTLSGFSGEFIDLKMPVWTPGSYLIREFSRNVESFQVSDNIPHQKMSKNTWRIFHRGEQHVVVQYRVYGFEISVRTNFIDEDHAFLSTANTFMYPDGYLDRPSTVEIVLPSYWKTISTGLTSTKEHTYYAANFDVLYDSPIEIGNQDVWTFDVDGVLHEFAMVGGGNYDKDVLSRDIQKIVVEENKIWGSNPNDRYVFITHNYQTGGGGLEHLNSTVLGASRNAYNHPTTYNNFLSLVAHEYFHLWHVKRLRPKPLGPFNYEMENYTSLLWIMEGFTAYYDNLITLRCGFRNEKDYLQMLALEFNTVLNRPGHEVQSVGLSSFDTWIKHYRPDENSSNVSISYYNKGAMLAVALDLKILSSTGGEKRLDNVLKAAYEFFYLKENRGFEELEFKQLAEQVTGVDLSEIFDAVYTTEDIDYSQYFNAVGYEMIDLNAGSNSLSLGIRTAGQDNKLIIKGVDRNSSAWHAGLNVNDEIIAVNGNRVDAQGRELDYLLQNGQYGEKATVLIARDGIVRSISTMLGYSEKKAIVIQRKLNSSAKEQRLGNIWLSLTD